jgi:uncharacterized membrane protein
MRKETHGNFVKRLPDARAIRRLLAGTALPVGLILSTPSYAYIDPATGSIILQSLLAGIAVAMGALRFYWAKVKSFFRRSQAGLESDAPAGTDSTREETKVQSQI